MSEISEVKKELEDFRVKFESVRAELKAARDEVKALTEKYNKTNNEYVEAQVQCAALREALNDQKVLEHMIRTADIKRRAMAEHLQKANQELQGKLAESNRKIKELEKPAVESVKAAA